MYFFWVKVGNPVGGFPDGLTTKADQRTFAVIYRKHNWFCFGQGCINGSFMRLMATIGGTTFS